MLHKRLFDQNSALGLVEWFYYDDETDVTTIQTQQDVEPLLDVNKYAANTENPNWRADMHRVASIPMNVFMDLKKKGIIDDQAAFRKWLNDADNRFFRTKLGIL